jgi:hypothetical protein
VFANPTSGTAYAHGFTHGQPGFIQSNSSVLGANVILNDGTVTPPDGLLVNEFVSRVLNTTTDAVSYSLTTAVSSNYATHIIHRTTATNQTLYINGPYDAACGRIFVHNGSAGTLTQFVNNFYQGNGMNGDFPNGIAGVSMTAGQWRLWEWANWNDGISNTTHNGGPVVSTAEDPNAWAVHQRRFAVIADGVAVGSPS